MIGFTGVHRDGFTERDVEMVRISEAPNLQTIPQGVLQFFPNFIGFHLRYTGIRNLRGDELVEYPNLQWFALQFNAIEYIPGNLFSSTPNVISVSFSGNQLRKVGEGLLNNLKDLHRVYFLNAVCINMVATTEAEIEILKETLMMQCNGD
jgi:hypothetical protein